MGGPLRRSCVRTFVRHFSAIRSVLVSKSLVAERWVQFDSDYSVEDDASPIFLPGKLSSDAKVESKDTANFVLRASSLNSDCDQLNTTSTNHDKFHAFKNQHT
jgi:hypothetical protein